MDNGESMPKMVSVYSRTKKLVIVTLAAGSKTRKTDTVENKQSIQLTKETL